MQNARDSCEVLIPHDVAPLREDILSIYRAAFTRPPYDETEEDVCRYAGHLNIHIRREGFRCAIAMEGQRMVGFAYGFRGVPDSGWQIVIREAIGPDLTRRWLEDAFELAEFAVDPGIHGSGIGSKLHDAVLTRLPYRTAVASTPTYDNPALGFYLRRGWQMIRDDLTFGASEQHTAVIGIDL